MSRNMIKTVVLLAVVAILLGVALALILIGQNQPAPAGETLNQNNTENAAQGATGNEDASATADSSETTNADEAATSPSGSTEPTTASQPTTGSEPTTSTEPTKPKDKEDPAGDQKPGGSAEPEEEGPVAPTVDVGNTEPVFDDMFDASDFFDIE